MSDADERSPKQDVVFVHSPAEHGEGYRVIRKRDDTIEVGELRNVPEGKPIHGELVKLSPRKEHAQLFDVEVVLPKPATSPATAHAGPARVATSAYREGWDAIFGKPAKAQLPN